MKQRQSVTLFHYFKTDHHFQDRQGSFQFRATFYQHREDILLHHPLHRRQATYLKYKA